MDQHCCSALQTQFSAQTALMQIRLNNNVCQNTLYFLRFYPLFFGYLFFSASPLLSSCTYTEWENETLWTWSSQCVHSVWGQDTKDVQDTNDLQEEDRLLYSVVATPSDHYLLHAIGPLHSQGRKHLKSTALCVGVGGRGVTCFPLCLSGVWSQRMHTFVYCCLFGSTSRGQSGREPGICLPKGWYLRGMLSKRTYTACFHCSQIMLYSSTTITPALHNQNRSAWFSAVPNPHQCLFWWIKGSLISVLEW